MPIPIWCIVVCAVILLILLLLSVKIKLVLAYENDFSAYLKILFIKIRIYPEKEKRRHGEKKNAKKAKKTDVPPSKAEKKKNDPKKIVKIIDAMKDTVAALIKELFGRLHFKFLKIYASIGCEDAAKTAIAYGTVTQSAAYLIELLNNVSNVDMSRSSDIDIRANFISQKSWVEFECLLYLRIFSALSLGIKALKAFFKFKIIQEKLSEVDNNNGTVKTE